MSYGSLSAKAIRTLNRGAKLAGIAHNTGEGGLSKHHQVEGGDLIWQLGTAYFGTRDKKGNFDPETFKDKSQLDAVKWLKSSYLKVQTITRWRTGSENHSRDRWNQRHWNIRVRLTSGSYRLSTPMDVLFVQKLVNFHKETMGSKSVSAITTVFIDLQSHLSSNLPWFYYSWRRWRWQVPSLSTQTTPPEAVAFVKNCPSRQTSNNIFESLVAQKWPARLILSNVWRQAPYATWHDPYLLSAACNVRCNTNTCPAGVATTNKHRAYAIKPSKNHNR